jgi:NADH/NAD ratio-sensing transcriptional regulator Rex
MKPTNIYNVLIIGAGNIASNYDTIDSNVFLTHAHAFSKHPGFNLLGFLDVDKSKAIVAAEKWSTNYFQSLEEVVNKFDIDVISITVPDEIHFETLLMVSKLKNIFVLTEKPLTQTLSEAEEIVSLYSKLNIQASINFKRIFLPEVIKIKERINNNEFGDFKFAIGYYNKGLKHNASHLINLFSELTSIKNLSLISNLGYINDFNKNDLSYSCVLNTDKGRHFIIKSFNVLDYPIFELDLHFDLGRIRFYDSGSAFEIFKIENSTIFEGHKFLSKSEIIETNLNMSMYFTVDNIFNFLSQRNYQLISPIEVGLDVMRITESIINEINIKTCPN